MADEVGVLAKLDSLLPADSLKDSGKKAPDRENLRRKKKKEQGENPLLDPNQEKEIFGEEDPPSGKILDIII